MAYKKQHLVSRVLLDRFGRGEGKKRRIEAYDVRTGACRQARPINVAFENRFITRGAEEAEARWSAVEKRLPQAFQCVDDRSLFDRPELVSVLRDAIALHWARSLMLKTVWELSKLRVYAKRREELLRDNPDQLARVFKNLTGLDPVGSQALEWAADRIYDGVSHLFKHHDVFAERVSDNYERMQAFAKRHPLQVAVANEGTFLISDSPVVTLQAGRSEVGPLQGVSLDEADAVALPIGPRHMIGLGGESEFIEVNRDGVEKLNRAQIAHAFRELFSVPGHMPVELIKTIVPPSTGR